MAINSVSIRAATRTDARQMASFAAQRFIDTFGFNYDPNDLAEFVAQKYNEVVFANYIENPAIQNLLAISENGAIIGYSQTGPMGLPLENSIPNSLELYRFYIADEAKGSGLAMRLFESLMAFVKSKNAPVLYLGVWSQNHRALAFYHKLGFEIVGKYLYQVGNTFDDERIMRLKITE